MKRYNPNLRVIPNATPPSIKVIMEKDSEGQYVEYESVLRLLRKTAVELGIFTDISHFMPYKEGYEIGVGWEENYVPGGPWTNQKDVDSKVNNKVWAQGFTDGKAMQAKL